MEKLNELLYNKNIKNGGRNGFNRGRKEII